MLGLSRATTLSKAAKSGIIVIDGQENAKF